MAKIEIQTVTVGQLADYFTRLIAKQSALHRLTVTGELTEVSVHPSGHMYFVMKEGEAILNGIMFRADRAKMGFTPRPGDKIDATGEIRNYAPKGQYQIKADTILPAGKGQYYLELEKLKNKLRAEGFFEDSHKKAIPPYCKKIGIITSKNGKAQGDIITNARGRNPYVEITLVHSNVEGNGAGEQIVRALKYLDTLCMDCIILGRGGGGANTLFGFNEEIVARAMFECETPIISAVGHEGDWTIADLVADLRVSTPSMAAVKAVFSLEDALKRLENGRSSLNRQMSYSLDKRMLMLDAVYNRLQSTGPAVILSKKEKQLLEYEKKLQELNPVHVLKERKQSLAVFEKNIKDSMLKMLSENLRYLDETEKYLPERMALLINEKRSYLKLASLSLSSGMENIMLGSNNRFAVLCAKLDSLSPLKRISGGYAYVSMNGKPVLSAKDLQAGDKVSMALSGGRAELTVDAVSQEENS